MQQILWDGVYATVVFCFAHIFFTDVILFVIQLNHTLNMVVLHFRSACTTH